MRVVLLMKIVSAGKTNETVEPPAMDLEEAELTQEAPSTNSDAKSL